jgi:hypothetical protein
MERGERITLTERFTARSLTIGKTIRALTISTLTIITLIKEYV